MLYAHESLRHKASPLTPKHLVPSPLIQLYLTAIVIGGGDYPHLHPDCLENFPYTSPKCSKNDTPILQFGSAFSYAQSLPNMIPMPMTATHLPCFRAFGAFGKVCADFSPKGHDDVPGKLVFGDEFGLNFEVSCLLWGLGRVYAEDLLFWICEMY